MRRHLLLLLFLLPATLPAKTFCNKASAQSDSIIVPCHFALFPTGSDSFWRDSIPQEMRQSYIQYGEQYLGKPWTVLPYSVFSEFKKNGNRVNYESLHFEKRRQLGALAMAEIIEGEGRFTPDIIDGLGSFCEETWWGLPAHYTENIPLAEKQEVDLFNAETASLIAWTTYMLKGQLDQFSKNLYPKIRQEIQRRILEPARTDKYWWKTAGMNWNPWICSNWLTCVMLFETDEQKKADAIVQIKKATQVFIDSYPEDGGCDEGPGYWDRSAASVFEIARLCPDMVDVNKKLRDMAAYTYKMYIGHDYCVNFADAHENKAIQQINIVYPFGLFLGDKTMCEFGAYLGRQKHVLENPAALYDKSGNFPTLGRELFFLRHINEFIAQQAQEPEIKDIWFGNLQIMTARRGSLFVAMKGGNNGENHNHNDAGSFVVYADNEPLLIDPGVGEYTSKTFSKDRYDIWTMQSGYHNLPQINGTDQKDGKQYAAKVLMHKPGLLSLDIAKAYPPEAAVKTWKRTIAASKSSIKVIEDYELNAYKRPTRLMFLTTTKPEVTGQSVIIGKHCITFKGQQLEAAIEDISQLLDPLLHQMWGKEMYRIVLSIKSTNTKNKIKYTIK